MAVTAVITAVLLAGGFTGCTTAESPPEPQPVIVAPGAPGEPGQILTEPPAMVPAADYTAVDVHFVHSMIAHHEQAVRMTELVGDHTARSDIALFARRIEVSQAAEMLRMEDWLASRGEPTRAGDDHPGTAPGMLTEDQFADLAAARDGAFDRLFLELMIYHHEGALVMVERLRAAGGGQEAELFELVSHIDVDQRIELDRMHRLLATLPG